MRELAGGVVLILLFTALALFTNDNDPGDVAFTFADREIVESSGLVEQDGLFWTVNDSGDTGRIFGVDPATGQTARVVTWSDEPTDVEALAPGSAADPPGSLWVGDIGDNRAGRDSVTVSRVALSDGTATSYELVYPDGPRDAETLLVHPRTGRVYLVSKKIFGAQLYAAPRRLDPDRPNRLAAVGGVPTILTDGAFLPDGHRLVLRSYDRAFVLTFPALQQLASFELPYQEQGEGLAVGADGAVYLSSEGRRESVLRVPLPPEAVASTPQRPTEPPAATPSRPPPTPDGAQATGSRTPDYWPWAAGGVFALLALAVLVRSLRPR